MNFRGGGGSASRKAAVVDVTALIDVVFQLLIFFLLTSSYVSQSSSASDRVQVDLPESSSSPQVNQHDDLTIAVTSDGRITGPDGELTREELAVVLVRAANKNPNTIVLIRGDKAAPYGPIAEVMAVARAAGLKVSAALQGAQ